MLTGGICFVCLDLAVERIPYRHWDVYRRRKQPITTGTYAMPNTQQQHQQQTSKYILPVWFDVKRQSFCD